MTYTSRGLRLNNPGDIRISGANWVGKVTPSPDSEFEAFDTMEHGIRAVAETLMTYFNVHGLKTLREMAKRYAPPTENDTGLYVETISERTGFDPDAPLKFPDDLQAVVEAFIDAEQGDSVHEILPQQFIDGVKMALA